MGVPLINIAFSHRIVAYFGVLIVFTLSLLGIVGWIGLYEEPAGMHRFRIGIMLGVVAYSAGVLGLLWFLTRSLNRAEDARLESEKKFRLIQEISHEGLTILCPVRSKDGRIVDFVWEYVNPAAGRIFRQAPEDLAGRRLLEVLPGFKANNDLFEYYVRVAETGQPGDDGYCYEAEGGRGWFHNMAVKLGDRIAVSFSVITDRKQSEQSIKEGLDMLAKAEHIGHTGSWRRDLTTDYIDWSDGTHRIFGFPENEKVSLQKFMSKFHPDDLADLVEKVQKTVEKGTPFVGEYRILRPDGITRHIETRGEASLDSRGKPVILHGTVLDITEKKILEDGLIKAQKLESLGTLAGGIAHDYNNLLAGIMGNIELAKMDIAPTDPAYAVLTEAEKAAMTARDLTQQIITFSKGGYPLSKIMQIGDLITQAVRLALSGSSTETKWTVADDLPEVQVDENQIRQVVQNITINAQEAMTQGGTLFIHIDKVWIQSDTTLPLEEGNYIQMVFRDEGSGISAENLKRIFDPYFTTKAMDYKKGIGLGLSICYSIIKKHRGHIEVESKPGRGTTVTIYIPGYLGQGRK